MSPQKIQPRWPFLIRSFIQLAIRERRVLSRHLWVADTAIKKTWINSEARCITVTQLCLHPLEIVRELIFSSWLSYNPPHSMYAFMLLFNKQLVPSFKTDCTAHPPPSISSSLSPPVKGGIPCMCPFASQEPHSLPSSSNIYRLSLFLRDHYCRSHDWPEHNDGWMVLLFQRFLLYLCIIHRRTITRLHESVLKRHDFLWKVLVLFWQLILVRVLKLHYLERDELRAHI